VGVTVQTTGGVCSGVACKAAALRLITTWQCMREDGASAAPHGSLRPPSEPQLVVTGLMGWGLPVRSSDSISALRSYVRRLREACATPPPPPPWGGRVELRSKGMPFTTWLGLPVPGSIHPPPHLSGTPT
jgi:hypothetical protein